MIVLVLTIIGASLSGLSTILQIAMRKWGTAAWSFNAMIWALTCLSFQV